METRFARIISVVLQPLLVPFYSLLIIFGLNTYISLVIPVQAKQMILALVFITTFLFPAIFIFLLYKRRIITTLQMENRNERIFPMIITNIFYFLTFHMIRQMQLPDIYLRLFFGSAVVVLFTMVISLFWKISAHMTGFGGLLGSLIGLSQTIQYNLAGWVVIAIVCCGLVGFARLKLKAHTQTQVYAGFMSGMVIMLLFIIS
ncbi:MAG: hypothetical protein KDC05_02305 [Bacteroidales bacterium]|nr:hypothetical protein [Bacteroidales bacterium]